MLLVFTFFCFLVTTGAFCNDILFPNITNQLGSMPTSWEPDCQRKTYLIGKQKVSWFEAFILCQQHDMELVTVVSAEEQTEIEKLWKQHENKVGLENGFWIAAARMGACGSQFVFFTSGKPVIYSKFAAGQPDNYKGVEACLQIFKDNSGKYLWNDLPCDHTAKLGFICQSRGRLFC